MKNNDKIIKSILEDISQIDYSESELDTKLQSLNVNSSKLVEEGTNRINQLRVRMKVSFAKEKQSLLERAMERINNFKTRHIENPKEELLKLFVKNNNVDLQPFFSKIKSIDDKDALEMLNDALLLEIIEELDNKENE